MEQPAGLSPSPNSSGFAGLLASLTSRAPGAAADDVELADDVVTISYEQALRNHARYRPSAHGDWPEPPASNAAVADRDQAPAAKDARRDEAATPKSEAAGSAANGDLRTSSVTIRLSQAECAQLRQRAVEAELTVSAYLRSCVLEAESLRAQVKKALAELKAAAAAETAAAQVRTPLFGWIRRRSKRKA